MQMRAKELGNQLASELHDCTWYATHTSQCGVKTSAPCHNIITALLQQHGEVRYYMQLPGVCEPVIGGNSENMCKIASSASSMRCIQKSPNENIQNASHSFEHTPKKLLLVQISVHFPHCKVRLHKSAASACLKMASRQGKYR